MKVSDLNFQERLVYIRNGKGGVDRQSALSGKAIALIRIYLSGTFVRDWLFVSDRKICGSGELFPVPVDHKPMSIRNAQYVYRNIADKLKFPGHTTLHSLRHSFGTHLIEDGLSIFSIQKMMGHQHIRTTLKYWIFKSPVRVF